MKASALPALLRTAARSRRAYYRMVDARYAEQIGETAQTVLFSWRYNPKGEFAVLYLSSSPECCRREKLKQVGGRAEDLPPQVVGSFDTRLSKCLDLTDDSCLGTLGIATRDLIQPADFIVTQGLARQARFAGFQAIIAPSAIGADCHGLVVFNDRLTPPDYCALTPDSVKPYL